MPKFTTLGAFLHAYHPAHRSRVVVLAIPGANAQDWEITDRGNGRFAIHLPIGGIDHYLTAEANGTHVFTAPKDPNFERQTWRGDQSTGRYSLGKSGRFLQADDQIVIQPDGSPANPNAPRGFDVELVRQENLTQGSEWQPQLT